MNVAIYGGAFNPPTVSGHRHALTELMRRVPDIDSVVVVPAYRHVFKPELETTFDIRLEMCSRTFTNMPVIISDAERRAHKNGCDGSTIQLIDFIRKEHPAIKLNMVVGVDNADTINSWKQPDRLVAEVPFIVVARGGYTPQMDWYKQPPHRYINIPQMDMSSSAIRDAIKTGDWEFVRSHVDGRVVDIIKREHLYGAV